MTTELGIQTLEAAAKQRHTPADGMKCIAEILDTWKMSMTPVLGTFTLVKKTDYFHADKDDRSIPLPGKPYMAIRIKRVKE